MSRYVEAETLIADIDVMQDYGFNGRTFVDKFEVFDMIDGYDAADAQPVQHGKWTEPGGPYINTYECSSCGRWFTLDYGTPKENNYNYCPNCGARMEEENEID